jgi:hypothetical protein
MHHDDDLSAQATIERLERDNTTLRIQLLTVTRDLAQIVAILADGHLQTERKLGDR